MKAKSIAAALLAALALQIGLFIFSQSNTYDEPAVLSSSAVLVGTGRMDLEKQVYPPLMKYLVGLSLQAAGPEKICDPRWIAEDNCYRCGLEFIYQNNVPPRRLLAWARLPSLLLALLLAAGVYLWSARWNGPWGAALSLALMAFNPNIIAHGGQATVDMGMTCFFFLALFFLVRHGESGRRRDLLAAGLAAGAAVAAKTPALLFFPCAPTVLWMASGAGFNSWKKSLRRVFLAMTTLVLSAAGVVLLLYQFRYAPYFFDTLTQSFNMGFGKAWPTYFHGNIREGGWWYFYPAAFLIKTPPALLAILAWALWRGRPRRRLLLPLLPVALVMAAFSLSSKQNGLRYILVAYPLLCVSAGALIPALRARWQKLLAGGLALCVAAECLLVSPHYLAYASSLVGGPKNTHRWLADCDLDWGQDFPAIQKLWLAAGRPELLIDTNGNADRDHFFGNHQDIIADWNPAAHFRHVNSAAPRREWLVISASRLHGWVLSRDAFAWLRDMTPLAQPGYSSFIYDISEDAVSHFNIGKIYKSNDKPGLALRQFRRAGSLRPDVPHIAYAEADTLALLGQTDAARESYRRAIALAGEDPRLKDEIKRRLLALANAAGPS